MRSVTDGGAKELLAIGGRSLLEHALADLEASGITAALVIVSPDKLAIERTLGSRFGAMTLDYAVQESPRGLADALALARPFTTGEPFVCWLPDNFWLGRRPATAQLLAGMARHPDEHGVALIERPLASFDPTATGAAGFVDVAPTAGDDALPILNVHPKGRPPHLPGPTFLKGFPLDLWRFDLFERIERQRRSQAAGKIPAEQDDTPILQELAAEGRLRGVVLRDGALFDCGVPRGYAAACAAITSS
ncbi:MAG: hypothetical protein EXS13_03285 [Planctomycetes bacterium]|nr:hypothetical protein [Planctomycetota bacterium]